MTLYEWLTIGISTVMAITSIVACIQTLKAKSEVINGYKVEFNDTVSAKGSIIAAKIEGSAHVDR